MKHITKYFALAGALMLFSSCNDFLDTLPKGKVIPTTVEDFGNLMKDMTLSTAYDGLPYYCSDDVLIPNRSINMSNATNKAYFWLESFYLDSEDDQNWNDTYNHLFTINVVLENIEGATGGTEEERRRIAAEAKIFRAYNYWYLQSLYGPAYNAATASTDLSVPLVTEPNLEAKHSRATVEQVTAQILKDLEGIEQDLPIMGSNNYKPTRAAAYAMKARVLFYLGRYDEAGKEAEKALELNNKIDDMREWSFPTEFPSGSINTALSRLSFFLYGTEKRDQFILHKLFGDIVYRTELHAFHCGMHFGIVGHDNEGLHLSLLSHPAQKVYTVTVRQTQVGNHDVIIRCLLQMFLRG